MVDHEVIVFAGGRDFYLFLIGRVELVFFVFGIGGHIGTGAGRAEIRMQRLATPGGLDEQHRLLDQFVHIDAEGEFRADFVTGLGGVLSGAEACGEFAGAFAGFLAAGEVGDPDVVADAGFAVRAAHFLEDGRGRRIITDIIEGFDFGMAFHVGLAGQNIHFEGSGGGDAHESKSEKRRFHMDYGWLVE